MPVPPPLAALYLRVSTGDQTTANQAAEVRQLATARCFEPVLFEETESAAKARPVFDGMMAEVRAGRVAAVAVWALDRLHRSMVGAISTVLECDRLGVPVLSVREPWLDTAGPVRPLLVAIFGWVAEQERARLIERTRAGLDRARRSGTKSGKAIGRPRASTIMLHAAADRVRAGTSIAAASRDAGLSSRTLRRFLNGAPGQNPLAPVAPTGPVLSRLGARRPGRGGRGGFRRCRGAARGGNGARRPVVSAWRHDRAAVVVSARDRRAAHARQARKAPGRSWPPRGPQRVGV